MAGPTTKTGKVRRFKTRADFPDGVDGSIKFAEYMITKWKTRIQELQDSKDPVKRLENQMAALKEKLENARKSAK